MNEQRVAYSDDPTDVPPRFGEFVDAMSDILNDASAAGMSANGLLSLAMNTAIATFIGLEMSNKDVEDFAEALPAAFNTVHAREAVEQAKEATLQ